MSLRFSRAIIVGASSGIGAELARQLVAEGCDVALVGRRRAELDALAAELSRQGRKAIVETHDVTNHDEAPLVFERLVEELGGLDLIVYAAGVIHVPEESVWDARAEILQLQVNAVGAIAWTTPAAAMFEAKRAGTILGISSIAGERGRRNMPGYTSSKAALTTWMEALRNRISRYGVNVVTVKPGFVDTDMTKHLTKKPMMIPVKTAARLILNAAKRGDSASVFVPFQWWLVAMMLRHMPSAIFRRLDI